MLDLTRLADVHTMQTPILMIHGMCCTGDVWSHFRTFFEARGARVYTPTLRPDERVNVHDKPPRSLSKLSLHDYVKDLEREVERIEQETGQTPAVIGHSMGGLLAQALAERDRVCAAVFISPAAPAGVRTVRSRIVWGVFAALERLKLTRPVIRPSLRTLSAMVLNAVPKAERQNVLDNMVYESGTAFSEFQNFPIDESKIKVPVLTVGAGRDRLLPPPLVRRTGRKYAAIGGDFREFREHGHWLYAEPGWERPAGEIFHWLEGAIERSKTMRPPAPVAARASAKLEA
jgi:pimeloyl-ACP methyl ester carboxylesterase